MNGRLPRREINGEESSCEQIISYFGYVKRNGDEMIMKEGRGSTTTSLHFLWVEATSSKNMGE